MPQLRPLGNRRRALPPTNGLDPLLLRLFELQDARDLTNVALAKALGYSTSYISGIRRGARNASFAFVIDMVTYFDHYLDLVPNTRSKE